MIMGVFLYFMVKDGTGCRAVLVMCRFHILFQEGPGREGFRLQKPTARAVLARRSRFRDLSPLCPFFGLAGCK